jgi:hypothetical protein
VTSADRMMWKYVESTKSQLFWNTKTAPLVNSALRINGGMLADQMFTCLVSNNLSPDLYPEYQAGKQSKVHAAAQLNSCFHFRCAVQIPFVSHTGRRNMFQRETNVSVQSLFIHVYSCLFSFRYIQIIQWIRPIKDIWRSSDASEFEILSGEPTR